MTTDLALTRLFIRSAEPEDALAVARVHVRSWQEAYRGLLPDGYLESLKPEDRAQRYSFGHDDPSKPATLVALVDDVVCGFATIQLTGSDKGELAGLYVDPEHWRHGIGSVLLAEARARLVARGCRGAELWVLAGNSRAERFYEGHGWRAEGVTRNQAVWGVNVQESRYSLRLP